MKVFDGLGVDGEVVMWKVLSSKDFEVMLSTLQRVAKFWGCVLENFEFWGYIEKFSNSKAIGPNFEVTLH